MDTDKPTRSYGNREAPVRYEPGEGCLTTAIRIPVRIVALLIVLPVRLVWDALRMSGRALDRAVLRPLGRGLVLLHTTVLVPLGRGVLWLATVLLVRPWVGLWRYVVVPVVRFGVVAPSVWLYWTVLTPLGHGLAWLLGRLGRGVAFAARTLLVPLGRGVLWLATVLLVRPWVGLWRYVVVPVVRFGVVVPSVWLYWTVLTPLGHGLAWLLGRLGRGIGLTGGALLAGLVWLAFLLVVTPSGWLYRRILLPVAREIGAALEVAWRIAGYLSRAVGRALAWLGWNTVGRPVRWAYRNMCVPAGHWLRDSVWPVARKIGVVAGRTVGEALHTARETVRAVRRDLWFAVVGRPRSDEPVEPLEDQARTLGSTTTVPGAALAPETSLHQRG